MSTSQTTASPRDLGSSWITSGEHQRLARVWLFVAFLYLVLGSVTGGLLSAEQAQSGFDVLESSNFAQIFTLHGVSTVFLFLMPAWLGLATALVPLQVGARNLSLPRLSAAALWTYVVGAGLVEAAYLGGGGPGGTDVDATQLWVLGLGLVLVALVAGSISVVATALAGRAPGVAMLDVGGLTWGATIGGILWILTLPIVGAVLIFAWFDVARGTQFFGGDVFGPIAWAFILPTIYLVALPALGAIGDVIGSLAGAKANATMVGAGLTGVAVLGFGGWIIGSVVTPGTSLQNDPLYQIQGVAMLAPALVLVAAWADTIRRGRRLRVTAALLFAFGAVGATLLAAAAGAAGSVDAFDLAGTTWISGQQHLVTLGIATLALFGGLHHWAPKLWGAQLAEPLGKVAFATAFVGVNVMVLPALITGIDGMPLANPVYGSDGTWEALSALSAVGGALVLVGVVAMGLNLLRVLGPAGEGLADDPWDGGIGLEWSTSSPPPPGNFTAVPTPVTAEAHS